MAERTGPDFWSIARYGNGDSLLAETKKASVASAQEAKKILMGGEETLDTYATASLNDNDLAEKSEFMRDSERLRPFQMEMKYGSEIADELWRLGRARTELARKRTLERDEETILGDSALSAAQVLGVQGVGGIAQLGAMGYDQGVLKPVNQALDWLGSDTELSPVSPRIAELTGNLNDSLQENKSRHMQEAAERHGRADALNKQDAQAEYKRQKEAAGDNRFEQLAAWGRREGQEALDTLENYADDPDMMGELGVQAIGSVVMPSALARTAASKLVRSRLRKEVGPEEAQKILRSKAGKEMVDEEAVRLAPAAIGVTESGATIDETQRSVMEMSEEELSKSEEYQALREDNLSHEEARIAVASDAGAVAALISGVAAPAIGGISARFVAKPLSARGRGGSGSSLREGATNTASEVVEEGAQGPASVLAQGLGERSIGLDTDLSRGFGSSAAEGVMGGAMAAGAMQGPGVVAGTVAELGGATAGGVAEVVERRVRAAEEAAGEGSGSSLETLNESMDAARSSADQFLKESRTEPPQTEPSQPTDAAPAEAEGEGEGAASESTRTETLEELPPEQAEAMESAQTAVRDALYLSDDETEAFKDIPQVKEALDRTEESRAPRASLIQVMMGQLKDPEADNLTRDMASMGIMENMVQMRRATSDETSRAVNALPEESEGRNAAKALRKTVQKLDGNETIQEAEARIRSITTERADALLEGADETTKAKVADAIGQTKAWALSPAQYDVALQQRKLGPELRRRLEAAREVSRSFVESAEAKERIKAEQQATIENEPDGPRKRRWQANRYSVRSAEVREDVETGNNRFNGLPSIANHYRRVMSSLSAGRRTEARSRLDQMGNFAQSQINKIDAYNRSSALDPGSSGRDNQVSFQAYEGSEFFEQKGIYANPNAPDSKAMVQDVLAETEALIEVHNALADVYAQKSGESVEKLETPELAPGLTGARQKAAQTPAATRVDDVIDEETEQGERRNVAGSAPGGEYRTGGSEDASADRSDGSADGQAFESLDEATEPASDPSGIPAAESGGETDAGAVPSGERTANLSESEEPVNVSRSDQVRGWMEYLEDTLVGRAVNRILTTFRARNGDPSSLVQHESPAAFIMKKIEDGETLKTDWNGLDFELTPDQRDAVSTLLGDSRLEKIQAHVEKAFADAWKNDTIRTKVKETKNSLEFQNLISMNFLTEDENGKVAPEPRMLEAAIMAGLEWRMKNASRSIPKLDDESIAKRFGMARDADVTPEMREAVMSGTPLQNVLEDMAGTMQQLLGLEAKTDAPMNLSQGLMRSMAANVLDAMVDTDVLDVTNVEEGTKKAKNILVRTEEVRNPKTGKMEEKDIYRNFVTFQPSTDLVLEEATQSLKSTPDIFSRIFTTGRERDRYVGTPPKSVAPTQLKNPRGKLSDKEKQVVERLQTTPFYLNEPFYNFLMDGLGVSIVDPLLGFSAEGEIMENGEYAGPLHKADALSKRGVNASLRSGFEGVAGYVAEIQAVARENGTPASRTPTFFGWRVSRVGRLQQQGPITPQANKIARELLTATRANLDLSNEAERGVFWLAVAQAADVSIEKKPHQDSISEIQDMFAKGEPLAQAAAVIGKHRRGGTLDDADRRTFTEAMEAAEAGGVPVTMKLMHALSAMADYQIAMQDGPEAQAAFETSLSLEADGKTDGPINAIMHMSLGAFDADQLRRLAKGGFFFAKPGDTEAMSLNRYISSATDENQDPSQDLYHEGATKAQKRLAARLAGIKPDSTEMTHAEAVSTLMEEFLPGYSVRRWTEEGDKIHEVKLGREVVKNPLTVFLYGSGVGGIAGKISATMLDEVYKRLSRDPELLKRRADLADALATVANNRVGVSAKNGFWASPMKEGQTSMNRLRNGRTSLRTELTSASRENLRQNVEIFFAEPMTEGIDDATGELQSSMKETQRATRVQARIFEDVFKRKVQERLAKIKDGGRNQPEGYKELLSEDDYAQIFDETLKIAPIYDTDAQSFHIVGRERSVSDSRDGSDGGKGVISANLNDQFSSYPTLPVPGEAGVKASPYLTIGTGDGRMILNIYADGGVELDPSLPVFDGVELALPSVMEGSRQINKAVYDGWMDGNVYEALASGFGRMLDNVDTDQIDPKTWADMAEDLGVDASVRTPEKADVEAMLRWLQESSDDSAARKAAIRRMRTYTDHMAGAAQPHEAGDLVVPEERLESTLNKFRAEELARIEKKRERLWATESSQDGRSGSAGRATQATATPAAAGPVAAPDPALRKKIRKIGETVPDYEAAMVRGDRIQTALQGKIPSEIRHLFKPEGELKDATFYFGTAEELTRMRDELYPSLPKTDMEAGVAYPMSRVVFVANESAETIMHEALHLLTGRKLVEAQRDPNSLSEEARGAVKRLDRLQQELFNADLSNESPEVQEAVREARDQANELRDRPYLALSEFVSWTLSNQHVFNKAKRTKAGKIYERSKRAVVNLLKKLLGIKTGPGSSILSNVRFDAEVLINDPVAKGETETIRAELATEQALNQRYGGGDRLARLERRFGARLHRHLEAHRTAPNPDGRMKSTRAGEATRERMEELDLSDKALDSVTQAGFGLNERQAQAFRSIHMALSSGMALDVSMVRDATRLFDHVLRNLGPGSLLENPENPEAHTEADWRRAREKFEAMTGGGIIRRDAQGRTDLMATFMALSQVDDGLRSVLENTEAPREFETSADSVDGALNRLAETIVNLITRFSISRGRQPRNIRARLDRLADGLSEVESDRRWLGTANIFRVMDPANDKLADRMGKGVKNVYGRVNAAREAAGNRDSRSVEGAWGAAQLVVSIGNAETAEQSANWLTEMMNKNPRMETLRSLLNDLKGMDAANAALLRMINPVKSEIDSIRQHFREIIPRALASHFSRKLSDTEWKHLFMGMGRADLLALGRQDALDLMKDPSSVEDRILDAEEALTGIPLGRKEAARYRAKAEALAEYMVTRNVTSTNLLRNANAIAHLFEEDGRPNPQDVTPELVEAIDRLTSLYAFRKLDPATKKSLAELSEQEGVGLGIIAGYHNGVRAKEMERADGQVAINNGLKGYIPAIQTNSAKVVVESDARHRELTLKGYVRLRAYEGDSRESGAGSRSYYMLSHSARESFRQGVAQTVHGTFMGVDSRTGISRTGDTAGAIWNDDAHAIADERQALGQSHSDNLAPGEHLMPVFNSQGEVMGYERPMSPEMTAHVRTDMHLGRMLGAWSGRIIEEREADAFNRQLVETLKETHDRLAREGGAEGFVNIADPELDDPVIRDAWGTMGWRIKRDAAEVFGRPDYLPVRRDMVTDAIGFRTAGLTDPWSGVSRWKPETQKAMRDAAVSIMGKGAYRKLSQVDTGVRDAVSYAKDTIVVKSLVVIYENLISNQLQLMSHGIGPLQAAKGARDKFLEISQFNKNREEIVSLRATITGLQDAPGQEEEKRRLTARMRALEDANARLSIQPLLEAGEFNTIAEDLDEADRSIREGNIANYLENQVEKLPGWGKTAAQNLLVTKDTALYKGLNRAVQYGDFVAKAVLYDHLKAKGMDEQEILDRISEEFVNYNRLPGRGRDYLESMGLLWFYNFKLRITKVVLRMVRERPLAALLYWQGLGPLSGADTIMDSSLPGVIADGSASYSVGPEMGLNSLTLNPWWNMTN